MYEGSFWHQPSRSRVLQDWHFANLGVWIGPVNTGVSGVADDDLLMSDDPVKLQGLIDIAEHYGIRYRITYGASKTKITISGSEIDIHFYRDTTPWNMGGATIKVVENNEHLGQIVSGTNQSAKNIDLRLKKGRGSLFSLLGPAFAYKCLLSPVLKLHLYRTFTCHIVRSGLSFFTLRQSSLQPLIIFQRKTLRSILQLSKSSSIPAIHFLTGELPIEGKIHRDVFSLFFSIWNNSNTKIYEIVKYILKNSIENSRTWSIFLRQISMMYGLEDPLQCLYRDPPKKSVYKENILTRITAFHETELREKTKSNSNMTYLNVSVSGLRGRHHPVLSSMITAHDVQKSRPHLKMLCKDYFTYEKRASQSGGSPHCRSCSAANQEPPVNNPSENLSHILTECSAYSEIRNRILPEFSDLCKQSKSNLNFCEILTDKNKLVQFILDPTSLNLQQRISVSDPKVDLFIKLARDYCFSVHTKRMQLLKQKMNENSTKWIGNKKFKLI